MKEFHLILGEARLGMLGEEKGFQGAVGLRKELEKTQQEAEDTAVTIFSSKSSVVACELI